jgi:hypothetical protein
MGFSISPAPFLYHFWIDDKLMTDDPGYRIGDCGVSRERPLRKERLFQTRDFAGGKISVPRNHRSRMQESRVTMRTEFLRFTGAVERDPAIAA